MSDDAFYCKACGHMLRDCDLPMEEPGSCPYCHVDPVVVISHAEWARRQSETRWAWEAAERDGLILAPGTRLRGRGNET